MNSPAAKGEAIVAETNFDLQTIDPARQFEFTGSTISSTRPH
ncbi:hypothetical protein [Brevibacterium otitidis]|uniref:Uncharacterized protein n=1 Tax=Brevibacterium otitidis TaxID=53364 RepID=A0ABV5X3B3_9MICO